MPNNAGTNNFQANNSNHLNTHCGIQDGMNGNDFPNQSTGPDLFTQDLLFGFMEEPSAFSQPLYPGYLDIG